MNPIRLHTSDSKDCDLLRIWDLLSTALSNELDPWHYMCTLEYDIVWIEEYKIYLDSTLLSQVELDIGTNGVSHIEIT